MTETIPSPLDRAALRKLAEAATPGPWRVDDARGRYCPSCGYAVFRAHDVGPEGDEIAAVFFDDEATDAKFIAATDPTTILTLLSALDSKDAEIARLTAAPFRPGDEVTYGNNPDIYVVESCAWQFDVADGVAPYWYVIANGNGHFAGHASALKRVPYSAEIARLKREVDHKHSLFVQTSADFDAADDEVERLTQERAYLAAPCQIDGCQFARLTAERDAAVLERDETATNLHDEREEQRSRADTLAAENANLRQRLTALKGRLLSEATMKIWDHWRRLILKVPDGSMPRDAFEAWLENVTDDIDDALGALRKGDAS